MKHGKRGKNGTWMNHSVWRDVRKRQNVRMNPGVWQRKGAFLMAALVLLLSCSGCTAADTGGADADSDMQQGTSADMGQGASSGSDTGQSTDAPGVLDTSVLEAEGDAVLSQIAASYSASDFVEGEVTRADLVKIMTAGSKAPSAKNAQPWHFSVVTDYDTAHGLLSAAAEGSALIVISGNPDIITDTLSFDCGLAAGYMQLAAERLGYGARLYLEAVRPSEKKRDALGIPKGYEVQSVLLVGKTAQEPDALSGATKRRALEDTVNWVEE